jgi:group I intron endonuclease
MVSPSIVYVYTLTLIFFPKLYKQGVATMPGGVYCIENLSNNKKYIGKSVNINNRWRHHKARLNRNKHANSKLQRAWNKYSKSNFIFYILELCDYEILNNKETYYINKFDILTNGYNLSSGGDGHSKHEISRQVR